MSKEGSTQAPTRHPLKFRDPDFINPEKIDQEMRRVFDICHGCRRCFNLCDSFPKLFDFIDETEGGEVSDLSSDKFKGVKLNIKSNEVLVSANNPEQEEGEESFKLNYSGEDMEIAFNVNYIQEVLSNIDSNDCLSLIHI